jgi:hypothetical protein
MPYAQLLAQSTFQALTPSLTRTGRANTDDADEDGEKELSENVLSVSVLLEFQPVTQDLARITWDALDVSLQVVEKSTNYVHPSFPFQSTYDRDAALPVVHSAQETCELHVEGKARTVLQKTVDVQVQPPLSSLAEVSFFDVNLVFKERQFVETDWCITASCYIGLHSARKVLYPIRCSFARQLVDTTGAKPAFYCSFAVKRHARSTRAGALDGAEGGSNGPDELSHTFPRKETLAKEFAGEDDSESTDESSPAKAVDASKLRSSASHGMRPIGPDGRLMTSLQRSTFAAIRKRFAKTAVRDRKRVLYNSDLYPIFTLGRDECAREMGTCPTWLKVRMRERGIKVWPNRKLIPTTSSLYRLKQQQAEILRELDVAGNRSLRPPRLLAVEADIAKMRDVRRAIVRDSCSPEFYKEFAQCADETVLDPDWAK